MNILVIILAVGFCIYLARDTYLKCHNVLKEIEKEANILEEKIKKTVVGKSTDNIKQIYDIAQNETRILGEQIKKYRQAIFANKQTERILDPGKYLSPVLLMNNHGKRKFAESIPGILTGIGIFGTFFGLVIGLFQIDIENLKTSIQQLVGGMYIA